MLHNFDMGLKYQLEAAKRKLQTLFPSNRKRRALFNLLGSTIKAISGNLDQEDAERYNKAITALEKKQNNVIENFNQHMSLTTKLIENFNKTTSLIIHNQEIISNEVNKIKNNFSMLVFNFNQYMQTRNMLDQLNLSLQIVLQLLTDLEYAITFSRINNSIIKEEEIEWIIDTTIIVLRKIRNA